MAGQIVVGVDGSESALRAVRWAATEAAYREAGVRLVHVRDLPLLLPAEDLYAETLAEKGREHLAAARAVVHAVAPGVAVASDLLTGQPSAVLVEEAERAGLVVVGSRGLGGFRSLLLGSVANALTAHVRCPVVVLRGESRDGPVVVGADGSAGSDNALAFAFDVAAVRGASVVAVLAWSYEGLVDAFPTVTDVVDWDEIAEAQRRLFDDQLAKARERHPDVAVRTVTYRGRPADALLSHADGARMVVVGASARQRRFAGSIGSTAYAVLHHATCPVAVAGEQAWPG